MKKYNAIIGAFLMINALTSVNAYAADTDSISQYYSNESGLTIYANGLASDKAEAKIAGVNCETQNYGDIYYKSDKYETVFLIDSSASMSSFSDEINAFLTECVDKKRSNEYYSIGMFSSENTPVYIADSINDQYALEKSLDKLRYDFSSTYIYDNLINTIDKIYTDDEPIYRRIVLITDGNENSARGITVEDVISELEKDPVPIYTVTLQTSTKDNLENLKNIARIARKSNAADIRISDGGDAVQPASILAEEAKNTYCISVMPPHNMMDGSIKAIELSGGDYSLITDIRMPMADQKEYTETEKAITETTAEVIGPAEEDLQEKNGLPIWIAAATVVIAAIAGIVIVLVRKKSSKGTEDVNEFKSDNDETMIISSDVRGDTEMLFDDIAEKRTVFLRDTVDSSRTFEIQLTGDGAVVGRSSDYCNIVIDYDKSISRKHCRLFLRNGQVYITDLSSGNKTYINDSEITGESVLCNADEIKIGRTRLKVTIR